MAESWHADGGEIFVGDVQIVGVCALVVIIGGKISVRIGMLINSMAHAPHGRWMR